MTAYDLVVIGSGPAGEGAAMQAAKAKQRVVVVERLSESVGACTHWGTIPSKALRHEVQRLVEFRTSRMFGSVLESVQVPLATLLYGADAVVRQQVAMRQQFYERNRVRLLCGEARFEDEHTVVVRAADGREETLTANAFVIATGGHPYRPNDVDFSGLRVFDSDTILRLTRDPTSITIYGAALLVASTRAFFVPSASR